MIAYQLPTGKTIYLSFEEWMNMTDLKEQEYIAKDIGYHVHDPFYKSSIDDSREILEIDYIEIPIADISDVEDIDDSVNSDELTE